MKQRNFKTKVLIVCSGFFVIFLLVMLTRSFYKDALKENTLGNDKEEKKAYYVMLVENTESVFWKSVYESAKQEAESRHILLGLSEKSDGVSYSLSERMEMYIAARVDGIILEYRGEPELEEQIANAVNHNIPVVTLLTDGGNGGAVSFVGANNYEMAKKYGDEIVKILEPNTKRVMILAHGTERNSREEQIYNQINSVVLNSKKASEEISVEIQRISSEKVFDTEEAIWSILKNKETIPDILVCFNERDTECAYQTLINYNLVGEVEIIGYHYTNIILNAIAEGIIPATIDVNTEQMGKYSIQALDEYAEDGYVNSFFDVDLSVIGQKEAEEMK